jgi:uncharacterized membrane protein YukC
MKYKTLLAKLQKLSPEELDQTVELFYGDGGSYSTVIGLGKTKRDNENLGCEEAGDPPSNWKKGQWYLIHSC